jgi:hypothetical protein
MMPLFFQLYVKHRQNHERLSVDAHVPGKIEAPTNAYPSRHQPHDRRLGRSPETTMKMFGAA